MDIHAHSALQGSKLLDDLIPKLERHKQVLGLDLDISKYQDIRQRFLDLESTRAPKA